MLHFNGKPYANCRAMSCYGATLGPFCPTHAAISDEKTAENHSRDAEREAWNTALASGDTALIEAVGSSLLVDIHTRIMDDDPNYATAGYHPRP